MSPLVAYHATNLRYREGIRQLGLLPSRASIIQPVGVYVYNDDFDHPVFSRNHFASCTWNSGYGQDVWAVTYIGPISPDQFVTNGLVLAERVHPEHVTLVTGNK